MSTSSITTTNLGWKTLKIRLFLIYLLLSIVLLIISVSGELRLLHEVGRNFGGFAWALNADNEVVIVSDLANQPGFAGIPSSMNTTSTIVSVDGKDPSQMSAIFQQARVGQPITYTFERNGERLKPFTSQVMPFTNEMWLQNYGLALIAGICWLLVGGFLVATARSWMGFVEGITLVPVAMLFLLYSHWGNIQTAYPSDWVVQLLWFPAFALLGAAFIHMSLAYSTEVGTARMPNLRLDLLPYLPVIALEAFFIGIFVLRGSVPTQLEGTLSLGYAVIGGILSLLVGLSWLLRFGPHKNHKRNALRRQLADLLCLWIGALGLGLGLGVLPVMLTGSTLLPLPMYLILGTIYPLILVYAVRSLRLIEQLQESMARTEDAMLQQQRTAEDLRRANEELQHATSLLLHADAHLRSLLSERIHDQPKQQALRIRSLLGHWQHKLKVEVEHDPTLRTFAQPVIDALGKVRKISEELEGDLRGLQLLVEDAYQRRSLGLKLHLEKLVREDLPALHPESPLKIQADLWALDTLSQDLERTPEGEKFAEAVSYTITQTLLNIYNHAGATFATVRATRQDDQLEVLIVDDGRGFDITGIAPEKTSMFKAELKAREAGGTLLIRSKPRPDPNHGTQVRLVLPVPAEESEPEFIGYDQPEQSANYRPG